jgi:hypothetical protein
MLNGARFLRILMRPIACQPGREGEMARNLLTLWCLRLDERSIFSIRGPDGACSPRQDQRRRGDFQSSGIIRGAGRLLKTPRQAKEGPLGNAKAYSSNRLWLQRRDASKVSKHCDVIQHMLDALLRLALSV